MRIVVMSTRMAKKTGFQNKELSYKKNQASDNKKRCMFYSDISKTIMHWQLQYCKIHTRNENKRQEKARCAQAHATSHSTTTQKKKISAHSPSLASTCLEPCTSQSLPLNMPCNAGWRPFLLQATLA